MLGDFDWKFKDVLKDLMVVMSLRGSHSTGITGVNTRNNSVKMAKVVGNPYDLFEHKPADAAMSVYTNNIVFAHGRHATKGEITKANAHPFQCGTITGQHNGTLDNHRDLGVDVEGTDSETLYKAISTYGLKDAVGASKGAWALMWYDESDKTMNVLRNTHRSLWWCMSENGKQMFMASEVWMLTGILGRHGVKLWTDDKGYAIFPFKEDTHYRIKSPENSFDKIEIVSMDEVKGDTAKQHSAPFQSPGYRNPWFSWGKQADQNTQTGGKVNEFEKRVVHLIDRDTTKTLDESGNTRLIGSRSNTTGGVGSNLPKTSENSAVGNKNASSGESTVTSDALDDELPEVMQGTFPGYNGERLSREEWNARTEDGCCYCGSNVDIEQAADLKWVDRDGVLCQTCWPKGPAGEQENMSLWMN